MLPMNTTRLVKTTLAILAIALAQAAWAEEGSAPRWYLDMSCGASWYNPADGLVAKVGAIDGLITQSGKSGTGLAISLTAGAKLSRYLSAEGSFSDFGETGSGLFMMPTPQDGIHIQGSLSPEPYKVRNRGIAVSLVPTLPITPSSSLFARVGLSRLYNRYSIALPYYRAQATLTDDVLLLGVGGEVEFARHWKARVEYNAVGSRLRNVSGGVVYRF